MKIHPNELQEKLGKGELQLIDVRTPMEYVELQFVGAGLTFAGITDWCGMGMLIAKAPWNQR